MQFASAEVVVGAEPEAVWERVTDVASAPEWVATARRTRLLPGPRGAVGQQWLQVDAVGPLLRARVYEVTRWEPPREFAFRSATGPAVEVRHHLEPVDGGTRVVFEMAFEPPVPLLTEVVGPAAGEALARRVLERSARALKAHVEGGGAAAREVVGGGRGAGADQTPRREVVVSEVDVEEDLPTAP